MACPTAILISGSGTNLQSFIDQVGDGRLDLDLRIVFSNNPDAYGLQRAAKAGIPTESFGHRDFPSREMFDRAVADILDVYEPELIILAGFMRILSPWFVRHYEGRILNIHPALLPKYPGLNTHERVLEAQPGDEAAHQGGRVGQPRHGPGREDLVHGLGRESPLGRPKAKCDNIVHSLCSET